MRWCRAAWYYLCSFLVSVENRKRFNSEYEEFLLASKYEHATGVDFTSYLDGDAAYERSNVVLSASP